MEEVFTTDGKHYHVKVNVCLNDLKQALALRAIILSFETSAERYRGKDGKGLISSASL